VNKGVVHFSNNELKAIELFSILQKKPGEKSPRHKEYSFQMANQEKFSGGTPSIIKSGRFRNPKRL
jgi:hypothetical protein